MTFEEFQRSRKWCDDIGIALRDESYYDCSGYLYLDCYFIESTARWPPAHRATGLWDLLLGNCEWQTNDLTSLEHRLYEWVNP